LATRKGNEQPRVSVSSVGKENLSVNCSGREKKGKSITTVEPLEERSRSLALKKEVRGAGFPTSRRSLFHLRERKSYEFLFKGRGGKWV